MIDSKFFLAYLLQAFSVFNANPTMPDIDQTEAYCLAKNIYYEAKSEDIQGQVAVAAVTMNRVKNDNYPKTVCEVVKYRVISKETKKIACAFTWYCDKNKGENPISFTNKDGTINERALQQFRTASIIAISFLSGQLKDNTNGATHFHNPHISEPLWARTYIKTMSLGNHDFYKKR